MNSQIADIPPGARQFNNLPTKVVKLFYQFGRHAGSTEGLGDLLGADDLTDHVGGAGDHRRRCR
ncbi:MAG: hypothetical protein Q8L22_06125 [Reyranella sp.]|nr:hypothetical protein [Reyranella sp.]